MPYSIIQVCLTVHFKLTPGPRGGNASPHFSPGGGVAM
jgi:hypothetical protein